jgi:uncharacterized protein (TIGR02391 family)
MSDIKRACFKQAELETLCKLLGDMLTGTEIGQFLKIIGVDDFNSKDTKWRRLFNDLAARQNRDQAGNIVLALIYKVFQPARFIDNQEYYKEKMRQINVILAFHGLEIRDDGIFYNVSKVNTLSEAERKASKLKESLINRNLHKDLLLFCKSELLQENYFHAVLEATKSIAAKIRQRTGLLSDGAVLIDEAFSGENPRLKINNFITATEKSEQKGFVNLAKGLFGTFRNPTAHTPKIEWNLSEEDALDLFTLASYVLRRIDRSN